MDEEQLFIAEEIFRIIKERQVIPQVLLDDEVIRKFQNESGKRIRSLDQFYDILLTYGFMTSGINSSGGTYFKVTLKASNFETFKDFLLELGEKQKLEKEELELKKKKEQLEIRYLEFQIWANEKWYVIAGVSALIGVVLTKLVETILIN